LSINYTSNSSNFSQSKIYIYSSYLINRWLLIFSRLITKFAFVKKSFKQRKDTRKKENLTKKNEGLFIDIKKRFSNFDFEVKFNTNGKPLGIIGSSGSGKSMTLKFIAGLETPNEGKIVLNGRVLFDSENKINLPSKERKIGFLFQNYALFPHLKVAHNIGFGLQEFSQEERKEIVFQYLKLMHLEGLEHRYPHELSGGQQQRVALARALAINPDAILLDEPLSALDNYLRSQIEELLIEVFSNYQGITLFVTHKLEEAYRICDNIMVLSQGKIIALAKKEDIFEHPPSYTVAQLTECKNFSIARKIDNETIEALDWNCALKVTQFIPDSVKYVGIRAHHLIFTDQPKLVNSFPCFLVKISETQHRVTLYLKLHNQEGENYDLQAEVFKEKWQQIKNNLGPWYVYLEPLKLILMEN
ncbi:MAG TPA: sulfate/molybdate ABC transporter ATP-binding protein, partial [Allocoleopsis sp.]